MIEKLNHYSLTNPASVYDEEALTALELAGRTAAKTNEAVEAFNNLERETGKHLEAQDKEISDRLAAQDNRLTNQETTVIPQAVAREQQRLIDNGTFDASIDHYAGDVKSQVAHLFDNVTEGTTAADMEITDARFAVNEMKYPSLGESIRGQSRLKIDAPMNMVEIPLTVTSGKLFNIHNEAEESVEKGCYARYDLNGEKILSVYGYCWAWDAYPSFALYDADGNRIFKRFTAAYSGDNGFTFAVPSNAVYIIISGRVNGYTPRLYSCTVKNLSEYVHEVNGLSISQLQNHQASAGTTIVTVHVHEGITTIKQGVIYAEGYTVVNETCCSVILPVGEGWKAVNLKNYQLGAVGGVFMDGEMTPIPGSAFSTAAPDHLTEKAVPAGAAYICISAYMDSPYHDIYVETANYNLLGLVVNPESIDGYRERGTVTTPHALNADNVAAIDPERLYTGDYKVLNNDYSTLIVELSPRWLSVLLSNYNIGTVGGCFLDADMAMLSGTGFSTAYPDHLTAKVIPANARFIAISAKNTELYKEIYVESHGFTLDGLNTGNNNSWAGKKVVWIGTSIPYGQGSSKSYAKEAANLLGFELVPAVRPGLSTHTTNGASRSGVSLVCSKAEYAAEGKALPDSPVSNWTPNGSYNDYYTTYENVFAIEDADLFVFDTLPNNGDFSLTDWESFDADAWAYKDGSSFAAHRDTFLGAMLFLMDEMWKANPRARMALAVGCSLNYEAGLGNFKLLSERFNIPIMNAWGKANVAPPFVNNLYVSATDRHINTYAHDLFGRMFAGELLTIA